MIHPLQANILLHSVVTQITQCWTWKANINYKSSFPAIIGGGRSRIPLQAVFQARAGTGVEPPTYQTNLTPPVGFDPTAGQGQVIRRQRPKPLGHPIESLRQRIENENEHKAVILINAVIYKSFNIYIILISSSFHNEYGVMSLFIGMCLLVHQIPLHKYRIQVLLSQ